MTLGQNSAPLLSAVSLQGGNSDVMYVVESGIVTCHVDFLRLHHRMRLPSVSQDVLAVAPVRYPVASSIYSRMYQAYLALQVFLYISCVYV